MIVPVLPRHQGRDEEAECCQTESQTTLLLTPLPCDEVIKAEDTTPDPYTKGVERSRIGVVSLAHLIGRLIDIQHDGYAGHKEEREDDPEILPTPLTTAQQLSYQSEETEDEGQHKVAIVPGIVGHKGGQVCLWTEEEPIDEGDARDPITLRQLSLPLYIILSTGEVP